MSSKRGGCKDTKRIKKKRQFNLKRKEEIRKKQLQINGNGRKKGVDAKK